MFTQKEAVFKVVCEFFKKTVFSEKVKPTNDQKAIMVETLLKMYNDGQWKIESEKSKAPDKLKSYTLSFLNNHLKKDKRLNGGIKYEPEKPGTRTGSTDKEVKAMRQLLNSGTLTDEQAAKLKSAIDKKIEAIKAEKAKANIDVENLPEEFRGLVG